MRIALFSDTFPPQVNGVAHVVAQAAMCLADRGHDVRVLTSSQGSREYLDEVCRGKYVIHNVASLPSGVYPELRATLPLATTRLHFKNWRPDIVHTHTPFGVGLAAVRCGKRFDVPLIGTHHTFFDQYLKHVHLDSDVTRTMSWKLTVAYYNQCDLVLVPSRSLADELKENGLEPPVRIVPNPIDTDLFHRADQPSASDAALVYMGRLSYEKSLDQTIAAFELVRRQMLNATLTIVGDGPERAELEEQAANLGIADSVEFTGVLRGEDLARVMRQCTVFVTTSKTENTPLSVLEAMACGLPVAAVRMLGLAEIVTDGVNGVLAQPDDPKGLADRIVQLLRNKPLLQACSDGAHRYAMGFSQAAIISEWDSLYRSALAVRHESLSLA